MRLNLRNLALDLGVKSGHTDYTKFIVLGRSRVGSNLLRSLLNDHPAIEAFGEVFRSPDSLDWDHIGHLQSEKLLPLFQNDPVAFLQTKLFRKYPAATAAVGFKIFYYHAEEGNWTAVWPYLEQMGDLRVIHLKRRNILKTHLSRKRAELTDSWVNTSGQKEKPVAVTLDYAECLADFERTRAYEEAFDTRFANHPHIEVIYEELARDYDGQMKRIQEFLSVPYAPVAPSIYKQSRQPLAEAISNYAALKAQFQGTPWAEFFQE